MLADGQPSDEKSDQRSSNVGEWNVLEVGRRTVYENAFASYYLKGDFQSEADMVKKVRVSLALQPVVTALFAYSPFTEGRPNGFQSYRSQVWLDTDEPDDVSVPRVSLKGKFVGGPHDLTDVVVHGDVGALLREVVERVRVDRTHHQ